MLAVWKSFIKNLLMTKSNDPILDFVKGHISRPYNNAVMHLLLINCILRQLYLFCQICYLQ